MHDFAFFRSVTTEDVLFTECLQICSVQNLRHSAKIYIYSSNKEETNFILSVCPLFHVFLKMNIKRSF
jgi:hypothetical protein